MSEAYRVLDLTHHEGAICAYLLAHIGADVIAIEPPGGSPLRGGASSRDAGHAWHAYGRGKKSLVLDLESAEGRERIAALARDADVLVESLSSDQASRYGLDYPTLAAANPGIIVVSITPFGRVGPKSDWPATDLTIWASSTALALTGDADRAPVRPSVPQSYVHAGADAAGAAMIALHERHHSGRGQHIDVSAQASAAQASLGENLLSANNGGEPIQRLAGGVVFGGIPVRLTWPCKDGHVAIAFFFGGGFDGPNKRLLQWVYECGACSLETAERDWSAIYMSIVLGERPMEPYVELCRQIEEFTRQLTMQELFQGARERGLYMTPTFSISELVKEPHFQARDYWHILPESKLAMPGAFAKLSQTPLTLPDDAPALNSAPSGVWSSERVQVTSPTGAEPRAPFAGLKVLDFMWVAAGPYFTRVLADYGATVVKVESTVRLDTARTLPAYKDGEMTVDSSVVFNSINAGKRGVTIDPSNPKGREMLLELVQWADVVTESFSPKAMKGWGLDYDSLIAVKPDLIMLSSCLMGQTGPHCQLPGFGNMAAAVAGFHDLTGWEDRSPAGPFGAYTDTVAPKFALIALMAALEHRRRTGEGQYIDVSQAEAAIHFLAPALVEHGLGGHPYRMGNRDPGMCPHGVFPTAGDDSWIAIACQNDSVWPALRRLAGLADDEALKTLKGRKAVEAELETQIATWTRSQQPEALQDALIAAGVAAHHLHNSEETVSDPQLAARNFYLTVPHGTLGELVVENSRFLLSRTPASITHAGPALGEHNIEVMETILGYDANQVADALASLAIQ